MNHPRAFLGQVPLAGATPGLSIAEGEEIPATGGTVKKRVGFLWFFPDVDARAKLEEALGKSIPESVEARVSHCNPTPGTFPALGDVVDPETGLICFLELPEGWSEAWMWGDVPQEPPSFDEIEPVPPFYVKYAGPATDGFVTAGPFEDPYEALDYAGARYGGSAPSVGHVEVYDSLDRVVIIT